MSENKMYRYLFEKLYEKSEREAVFIYEMIITRTIELIDLLSKAKAGRPDTASYDVDFDVMHLKMTVSEIVDKFTSASENITEYIVALKKIFSTTRNDLNSTIDCKFYMSSYMRCLCAFGLADESMKGSLKTLSSSINGMKDIPEIPNKRALIANTVSIFANAVKSSMEKEDYFNSLNKLHDMYNHIRWLYIRLNTENAYQIYNATSVFMMNFLGKYNYHYSEIISLIILNANLDDVTSEMKKNLYGLKLESFGKMTAPNALSLYESRNYFNSYDTENTVISEFYEKPEVEIDKIFKMRENPEPDYQK